MTSSESRQFICIRSELSSAAGARRPDCQQLYPRPVFESQSISAGSKQQDGHRRHRGAQTKGPALENCSPLTPLALGIRARNFRGGSDNQVVASHYLYIYKKKVWGRRNPGQTEIDELAAVLAIFYQRSKLSKACKIKFLSFESLAIKDEASFKAPPTFFFFKISVDSPCVVRQLL